MGNGETGFVCCFGGVSIDVVVIFEFGVYYFVERIDDQTMRCVIYYNVRDNCTILKKTMRMMVLNHHACIES